MSEVSQKKTDRSRMILSYVGLKYAQHRTRAHNKRADPEN